VINKLWGTVSDGGEKRILLHSSFIEWDISMGERCKAIIMQQEGTKKVIYIHLLHREDTMKLFGFSSSFVRETFLSLQKVNGIGPKQALGIVSELDVSYVWRSIKTKDFAPLSTVSGLGKKKIEQIFVQLKDNLPDEQPVEKSSDIRSDIILGLVHMGYTHDEVYEAMENTPEIAKDMPEDEIFRLLLKKLGGRSI